MLLLLVLKVGTLSAPGRPPQPSPHPAKDQGILLLVAKREC